MANHVALAAVDANKATCIVAVLHQRAGIVSQPACYGSRLAGTSDNAFVDAVTNMDGGVRTKAAS